MEYGADGKEYVKNFKKDVLLKKSDFIFEVELVHDNAGFHFNLLQPSEIVLSNRRIEVTDQEDKLVRAFPLDADMKLVEWDGADEKGLSLARGVAYSYSITGMTKSGPYRSSRKNFVTDPDIVETTNSILFRFPAVNFGYDNAAIRGSAYPILKNMASRMREVRSVKTVKVNGYTDNSGTRTKNMKLSLDRATTIKDYFVGVEGFSENLFIIKGFGDVNPVASNDSEENRMKNRRVEIYIEK